MDLTLLLPQDALGPFAEEISGRQRRRERRAGQEAKAELREAAAAADAAAASRGLSAQELKVGFHLTVKAALWQDVLHLLVKVISHAH